MTCRRHKISRRSFTLLEVLVALGLAAALLSTVFSFYFNVLNTRSRLLDRSEQFRAATTFIDRIEADLLVCVAGSQQLNAGVVGDSTSLTIAARSVAASLAERGLLDPAVYSDLQITEYMFDQSAGRIELSRRTAHDDETETSEMLTDNVARVRLRYYDGTRWSDSWNSITANVLPHAVEIAIWFDTNEPDTEDDTSENAAALDTFDDNAGFDEFEFAMREDRGFAHETLPDRLRIICIPDAAEQPIDDQTQPFPGAAP